ncbi:MAG: carbohydrate kinase [Clostridia bacterium]|nr:carbohydrate kinase [Clostridia bacterium]
MEKTIDVIAVGELLMDFTTVGQSAQGNEVFEACPGGAPSNVLSILNKIGLKTGFIGKVGADQFGSLLRCVLDEIGVDTSNLATDPEVKTTLAFVHTGPGGERDFSFYRNPGADMMLSEEDIDPDYIRKARALHFGSLSMTHDTVRKATLKALETAKKDGMLISFDPNLRPPLWNSLDNAKKQIETGLSYCDVLKISDNEVEFLTGETDYDKGIAKLREQYDIPLIFLTLGPNGSRAYYKNLQVNAPGIAVDSIEATGAGDTFCGTALSRVLELGLDNLNEESLLETLQLANAAAAIVTTRKGAIRSMPEVSEVHALHAKSY